MQVSNIKVSIMQVSNIKVSNTGSDSIVSCSGVVGE